MSKQSSKPNRVLRRWLTRTGSFALLASSVACGSDRGAAIDGRLWVSGIPTSPKESISAFVLRQGSDPYGLMFHGTAYRGTHDVVRWHASTADRGTLTTLADGTRYALRIESCKPTTGFDHCVVLRGGPVGRERFQSRKRWAIGKKASTEAALELLEGDVFAPIIETTAVDSPNE